jgi:SAM-dependent methyltransferase
MNPSLYEQVARIEDCHWWYVYRRQLVADCLSRLGFQSGCRVLDIGCGTGGNLNFLSQYSSNIFGLDLSPEGLALAHAKYPAFQFVRGNVNQLERLFKPESFDLITDFNVLYHNWVPSELEVLRQVCRILRPGGMVLCTEPAFNFLYRGHDELGMGKRRYRLAEFRDFLSASGFEPVALTYYNSISFLPTLALALLHRLKPGQHGDPAEDVKELNLTRNWLDRIVLGLLQIERNTIHHVCRMPIGVTLLAVGRKPAG